MNYLNKETNTYFKRRIALIIQYDGSTYSGWQRQSNNITIQQVLEEAISIHSPDDPVKTFAAGRTDAGVHAAGQIVHFDFTGPMPTRNWVPALNGLLPKSIKVLGATQCPKDWHACFSAISRRYRYTIYNGINPNIFIAPWSWHKYQYKLDDDLMFSSLEKLLGFHDFSAFQRSGSNRKNAFTTIQDFHIKRNGDVLQIEIQASGFLYGMVRLIVGQLVALGEHKLKPKDFERRWKEKLKNEIKEAAPAKGLCFLRASYKDNFFPERFFHKTFPEFSIPTNHSPPEPPLL